MTILSEKVSFPEKGREARVKELEEIARILRIDIVVMTRKAGSGHPGGSLSIADILTVLFFEKMNHRPHDPHWEGRDRLILSKGHCSPGLYAAMARSGYFEPRELLTFRKFGSRLQGHPEKRTLPGIEVSTGSLGHGLSISNGIALAFKIDSRENRVYCILGDGETQEGMVWEAAMSAGHRKLDNLCAILDHNNLQIDGTVDSIKNIEPVEQKWKAFGWYVKIINGHSFTEILDALDEAETVKKRPSLIIAKTTKGKGVSFMENNVRFHGQAPTLEELKRALKELGAKKGGYHFFPLTRKGERDTSHPSSQTTRGGSTR